MAIEQVTTEAFRAGEVSVAPLRANDLVPLAAKDDDAPANESERPTGTG